MPKVSQYYPGDFYGDVAGSLAWLYTRQENSAAAWEANALHTGFPESSAAGAPAVATVPALAECGFVSQNDLGPLAETACESLTLVPLGILNLVMDNQTGPDGFPVDYSPIGLPWGNLLAPVLPVTASQISATYQLMYDVNPRGSKINGVTYPVLPGMTIYGYLFNLRQDLLNYRVDLFSLVGNDFYYQSSALAARAPTSGQYAGVQPVPSQFQSLLVQQGLYGYWGGQVTQAGTVMAALYPSSVNPPSTGWSGTALPAGWICHSNTGVGYRLSQYWARIYVLNGQTETLQEDDIPIVVQDDYHARCGSSAIPASGTLTVHVMYQDPVNGPTQIYSSRESLSTFESLPLSYVVPTSDPLYVPDPSSTTTPAVQNRSSIYDCALAIITFAASGNFIAAARIVKELDSILDNTTLTPSNPANTLAFSYDTYYGQADQAYVRTGAMAWVCYAYSVYMQLSQDFSPALCLQRMLNYLLSLESTASDLTNGLFYQGFGSYNDSQYVTGVLPSVLTQDQVDLYFAFLRGAGVLQSAAIQLPKTNLITAAQATSLQSTAALLTTAANTIATELVASLYIAPSGSVAGHFAQGASSSGLDTSQALSASARAALFCDAIGRDDLALECVKFVVQTFLLSNQQITISTDSNSYNRAYQQLSPFSGFKPYNDSPGGASGAPATVWQEGTWGVILALMQLYSVSAISSYLQTACGGIDTFLTTLITSQRSVRAATGDGSLLAYSLASRAMPYQFEVWPAFAATAWFWLVATNPGLLLSAASASTTIPYLQIPQGVGQSVNELEGSSSLGSMTVTCIDPNGTLKGLAAQDALVGRTVKVSQGFPGLALGDFTTLHTMQITQVGQDTDGRLTIQLSDVQRFIQGIQIWLRGGPLVYVPGGDTPSQPVGASWLPNGYGVSTSNPRYVAGNPIDILLAILQNELGIGQDPALQNTNYVMQSLAPDYDSAQDYEPAPPPEGWVIYTPGQASTLINPNSYIDVDGFLALRDSQFSGIWFEFVITRPIDGKQFIEEQILKPLGLYTIVRPDGRLSLKTMKPPRSQTPVFAFSARNILGIPQTQRQDIINLVTLQMDVQQGGVTTSARSYGYQVSYEQKTSVSRYRQVYQQQVQSTGVRVARGGMMLSRLLADRVFRRHAFAPPAYKFTAMLATECVELGDYVWLSHAKVLDLKSGKLGLNNAVCEVIDKQPNYAAGTVDFTLLDTRFIAVYPPYQIATAGTMQWMTDSNGWGKTYTWVVFTPTPVYAKATAAQQESYMYISSASLGGKNSDGTDGHTIY